MRANCTRLVALMAVLRGAGHGPMRGVWNQRNLPMTSPWELESVWPPLLLLRAARAVARGHGARAGGRP